MKTEEMKTCKRITLSGIKKFSPCPKGLEWFKSQKTTSLKKLTEKAIEQKKYEWAIWLATKLMDKKQNVIFAIYCAEQCIQIYESAYPDDKRPRLAIEAAKTCVNSPTTAARDAAWAAGDAAGAAGDAAYENMIRQALSIICDDSSA